MNQYQKRYFHKIRSCDRIRVDDVAELKFHHPDSVHSVYDTMKPIGLWYAFGTEWIDWCVTEHMGDWISDCNVFKIYANPDAILQIKSDQDIVSFNNDFKGRKNDIWWSFGINWSEVAKQYSGIEINPYNWERRLDPQFTWYYSWDVASGCIWDLKAIKKISMLNIRIDDNFFLDPAVAL